MPTIRFSTNVPVEVRLRAIEGRPVESQFGGVQHQFSCEEGAFYVSETVGAILTEQFRRLRVQAGEPVEICKGEVTRGPGRKGIQWIVTQAGEQPDGTFAVPKVPEAPKAPASELEQQLAQSLAQVQPKWAQALSMQTRHLVDVYAELVTYASARHGNAVRADDIRALMTTAFINLSKSGSNSNAA
jgi:hypothetical protein